jgi:spore germination cell wall hydrolase CwlJ-like protein
VKTAALILMLSASAVSGDTLLVVSKTIWGEARNQSYAGKYAVASVIWNRAEGKAHRLSTVCLDRKQFSCWQKRVFTQKLPDMRKPLDRAAWRDCVALASIMLDGSFLPSLESKHYHEASIQPYWSVNMKMLARVDGHKFYR